MLDVSLLTEMAVGEGQDVEEGMLVERDLQEFFAKDYQVRTKYIFFLIYFVTAGMDVMGKRVMMGKSACDDAVKGIEKDLNNMKRDTECHTEVRVQFLNLY